MVHDRVVLDTSNGRLSENSKHEECIDFKGFMHW